MKSAPEQTADASGVVRNTYVSSQLNARGSPKVPSLLLTVCACVSQVQAVSAYTNLYQAWQHVSWHCNIRNHCVLDAHRQSLC